MPESTAFIEREERNSSACSAVPVAQHNATLARNAEMLVYFSQQRRSQLLWDAQRLTNSPEEAEEVVQESLLKAWRNLQQFRGDAQIGTWLRAIVRNTAREWLRNRGHRVQVQLDVLREYEDDDPIADLADTRPNPEELCQRREMEEILHSEIQTLNLLSRQAIELCALEEQPLQDAARALDIGMVAIKSRLFRGRRALERGICQRTGGRTQCLVR